MVCQFTIEVKKGKARFFDKQPKIFSLYSALSLLS